MLKFPHRDGGTKGYFELVLIPCGIGEMRGDYESWRVSVICMPNFSNEDESQRFSYELSRSDLSNGQGLDALLARHPFLCANSDFDFILTLCDGSEIRLKHSFQPGKCAFDLLVGILGSSFEKTNNYFKARSSSSDAIISSNPEKLNERNFVNVLRLFRDQCGNDLAEFVARIMDVTKQQQLNSWSSARALMEKRAGIRIRGNKDAQVSECAKGLESRNDEDLTKYRWLLASSPKEQQSPNFEKGKAFAEQSPSPDDLVFAILQNADLARRFGLIVDFDLMVPTTRLSGRDVEALLTLRLHGVSKEAALTDRSSTAVFRSYVSEKCIAVQPLSRYEARGFTLLTCLRSEESARANNADWVPDPETEYGVTSFSADQSLIKDLLLPDGAAFSGYDKSSQYPPTFAKKGIHPLTGLGMTFWGPRRDLVPTSGFAKRACAFPLRAGERVLFFEDLWNGYRLDIAPQNSKESMCKYWSIHSQRLEFKYEGPEKIIIAETEDYISRDQRVAFNKPRDVCQSELERVGEPKVHPALFTWNGLGTIQQSPWSYEHMPSPYDSKLLSASYVRDENGKVLQRYPNLEYDRNYKIRSRTVFQGGIGLERADADKLLAALSSSESHKLLEQCLTINYKHSRNTPFPAGVLVFNQEDQNKDKKGVDLQLILGRDRNEIEFWLYPTPIGRDEALIHGLLRTAFKKGLNFACVEGALIDFLKATDSIGKSNISYFPDPDVHKVSVSAWLLGNYWIDPSHGGFKDRTLASEDRIIRCTDIMPYKIQGSPSVRDFGITPFAFRPILFRIYKGDGQTPRVKTGRSLRGFDYYDLAVPVGDIAKLEIVPVLSPKTVLKSSFAREYMNEEMRSRLTTNQGQSLLEQLSRTPGLTTPVEIEVIHATPSPVVAPRFERVGVRNGDNKEQIDVQVHRNPDQTAIAISCSLRVDARTTGRTSLSASWNTYTDDLSQPGPSISGTPSARTEARSVYFGRANDLKGELKDSEQVNESCCEEMYCAEESVIYDPKTANAKYKVNDASIGHSKIEMADLKHHRIQIHCVARGRYAEHFSDGKEAKEKISESVQVDVPSSQVPLSPDISHVIPFQRIRSEFANGQKRIQLPQKLRIYLRRPWGATGSGEMLAVLFDASWRESNRRNVWEVKSPSTSWGEDPVFRTFESETVDNLTPGLLMEMFAPYAEQAKFDDNYPVILEAELTGDGFNLIKSNIGTKASKTLQDYRSAHLVCIRPSYDREERLWYIDLDPGDRARWFRLNIRRFQPNSLPGYHLSRETTVLNFLSVRSDTITITRRVNVFEITLDIVPYSGQYLADGLPDISKRFRIVHLKNAGNGAFIQTKPDLPQAVVKNDRGNCRYVWKLPQEKDAFIGIRDEFKKKYIITVNTNDI